MKRYLLLGLLFALLPPARILAANPAPDDKRPVLALIVVESLSNRQGNEFYEYNVIAEEFSKVFAAQNWPVKLTVDRFAANNESHEFELQMFYRGIFNEFGERVFRAWMVMYDHGVKHDLGMLEYRYTPRPGELVDDTVRAVFRGAAKATVPLVQPFVGPKSASRKP
jgi:hypothetical protein